MLKTGSTYNGGMGSVMARGKGNKARTLTICPQAYAAISSFVSGRTDGAGIRYLLRFQRDTGLRQWRRAGGITMICQLYSHTSQTSQRTVGRVAEP